MRNQLSMVDVVRSETFLDLYVFARVIAIFEDFSMFRVIRVLYMHLVTSYWVTATVSCIYLFVSIEKSENVLTYHMNSRIVPVRGVGEAPFDLSHQDPIFNRTYGTVR